MLIKTGVKTVLESGKNTVLTTLFWRKPMRPFMWDRSIFGIVC